MLQSKGKETAFLDLKTGKILYIYIYIYILQRGPGVAAMLVERSRDQSPVVSLGIFSVVSSDKTMFPEVDSASENEYLGFLLG